MNRDDPRVSDKNTGLPSLDDIEMERVLLVYTHTASIGIATSPLDQSDIAVRFLHLRGIANNEEDVPVWTQMYIAVPVSDALDVAAALAKGTDVQFGEGPEDIPGMPDKAMFETPHNVRRFIMETHHEGSLVVHHGLGTRDGLFVSYYDEDGEQIFPGYAFDLTTLDSITVWNIDHRCHRIIILATS